MFRIKSCRMIFTVWLTVVGIFFLTATAGYAKKPHGRINRAEARSLVIAILQARGYDINSPKLNIEKDNSPYFRNFYHFSAYFDTPDRLALIEAFAVDPETADVWEKGLCKRVKTKKVQEIQKILHLRHKLGKKQNTSKPPCDER